MRTVIIRLPGEDFPTAIVRMREWLDANECEPTGYRYDQNEDMVVMSVEFAVHSHAGAFARRFDGKSGPPGDSPRSLSGDPADGARFEYPQKIRQAVLDAPESLLGSDVSGLQPIN
jgi:hypothetical protein